MSALTFSLKTSLQQRVDCSPLTPDKLASKSAAEIAAIELASGNRKLRVDSLFDIRGVDTYQIVFVHSSDKLDHIGGQMKSGSITIHGNAGSYLGFQMRGGDILLHGDAGIFAASGMSGGLLHIEGNVGDFLAAAIVGDRAGMRGGTVIVTGNAGDRVGDQMRRGLVLIEGNTGSYCASRMLAGTIAVLGTVGDYAAYGMRRGTLLLAQKPALHATIKDCGIHTLPFLSLMFKSFGHLPTAFAQINKNRVQRYAGDVATDGKGEILVLQ